MDSLINNLTGYFETKVELVKVEVRQELAKGISQAVVYLALVFAFAMVVLFVSLGVAILLADVIGALAGYSLVALFYLIVGLSLFVYREKLIGKINSNLSKTLNSRK
ncbi:MAG TPA: phage holin family protein [Chryseosolibacter sp.]|nr:phage holin family protein [Chryseosolibacter sp.]